MRSILGKLPLYSLFLLIMALGVAACTTVGPPRPVRLPSGAAIPEEPTQAPPRTPVGEITPRIRDRPDVPRAAVDLPEEVRALWVVRTTLTHPDSIRVMVDRAARAGFNTLLVQVRGRGDAYYRSRWEPRPESVLRQGGNFDPLELVIQEAHARGLGVHAWVNAHLVGGMSTLPSDPLHLIRARPDLLAVPRGLALELYNVNPESSRFTEALLRYAQDNSDRVEGMYTAPSHPEVKEHIYSVWMDLAESYDLDGLHFDYVRYPNSAFDYSRGALERFREWVYPRLSPARRAEIEGPYRTDPLAWVEALPGPWAEFRRAQITELVERIYHGVKKRRPDVVVSAAVFANAEDAFLSRFQDWKSWIAMGILDAVAPMAYTSEDGAFEAQIQDAVDAAGVDRVWAGIGVYTNTYRGTINKIDIARRLGARGVVLFSYDWAVSQGESDGERSFLDRVGAEAFRRR